VSSLVTIRLANDLRALLRVMSMCVESLRERIEPDDADRDFGDLEGAIDSAFHIVRELIATEGPQPDQAAVVDVNDLVVQLESVLTRVLGPQIRLTMRLDAADTIVEAEAVQLEWVLLNLAANSRDAMPNGGVFGIDTATVTRHIGVPSREVRYVRLTITDTGLGLAEEAYTRAFEPFFSTRDGRSGLGLTSVAMIVRRYRGWLHIDSDSAGTRVHIHIPALVRERR
jgi:signal transduction histidine kinase